MDAEARRLIINSVFVSFVVFGLIRLKLWERNRPKHEKELMANMEQVAKLRKQDQAAADRLVMELAEKHQAAEDAYRAELRAKAQFDRKAAKTLIRRLEGELASRAKFRKAVVKQSEGQDTSQFLKEMDEEDAKARQELDTLRGYESR